MKLFNLCLCKDVSAARFRFRLDAVCSQHNLNSVRVCVCVRHLIAASRPESLPLVCNYDPRGNFIRLISSDE